MTRGRSLTATRHHPRELSILLVPLDEARRRIDGARWRPITPKRVVPVEGLGRVSAETVRARHDEPPTDTAAMDGYAVRALGSRFPTTFRVRKGLQRAGSRRHRLGPGEAVAITTGAPLPPGAGAVVRKERGLAFAGLLRVRHRVFEGRDVHRQGEDVARGTVLLRRGERVRPYHVGLLLAQGYQTLKVLSPRVTIVPIGDELAPRGPAPRRGRIPDSISPVISGLMPYATSTVLPPVPDDRRALAEVLRAAARSADLVVTIGGTSVGPRDLTKPAVASVGRLLFGGVRVNVLKRGAVGTIGRTPVVLLPGQIVSAVTVWHEHGLRVLSRLTRLDLAPTETVVLARPLTNPHAMDSVYLFRISNSWATPCRWGVRLYSELLSAQGFGTVRAGSTLPRGATLEVQRLAGSE
jgi:molybdopterin molybdotransferase